MFLQLVVVGMLYASLLGCSALPKFQKTSESHSHGYDISKMSKPGLYSGSVYLPAGISEQVATKYIDRAIGEVCSEEGLPYFLPLPTVAFPEKEGRVTYVVYGACFPANRYKTIRFVTDPDLKVSMLLGDGTDIEVGDAIKMVEGAKIYHPNDVELHAQYAIAKKRDFIQIDLQRHGQFFRVEEPVVEVIDRLKGPEDLAVLREEVR